MQPQVVDLNEVVNNVSKMLRRILGEDIALEVWREHAKEIDLVVTDLVLPNGMAGRELAQALQASRSGLKIIYTSGYDTENMVQDAAVGAGPNFIQKPFHARKLAEVVYDCLNEK
jgi:DNA-binding NtrC family response regulator